MGPTLLNTCLHRPGIATCVNVHTLYREQLAAVCTVHLDRLVHLYKQRGACLIKLFFSGCKGQVADVHSAGLIQSSEVLRIGALKATIPILGPSTKLLHIETYC